MSRNYLSFILLLFVFANGYGQQRYSFTRQKMGSPFTIVTYGDDKKYVDSIIELVYDEVDRLNEIFSDYLDSSELNKLNSRSGNGEFITVSTELFDVISMSVQASVRSGGAFDITVGPLSRLWRSARKENSFPLKKDIRNARKKVGYRLIVLDKENHKVKLKKKNMALDMGGIAKGYIAQKAMDILKGAGLSSSLVDAGGDMVAGAPPPSKDGWSIGISMLDSANQRMDSKLLIAHKAVATSGDTFQHIDHKGRRYSHIINPKTGKGVTFHRNVTVIAPDGSIADWTASACSVMRWKKLKSFLKETPEVSVFINEGTDNKPISLYFNEFEKYMVD